MKLPFILFAIFCALSAISAYSAETECSCKCVVKEDGKYSTQEASGKGREAAGEALKKKLGTNKCELSPTCSGSCSSDTKN